MFPCTVTFQFLYNNIPLNRDGAVVKNRLSAQETREAQVQSLGWEDALEEEMSVHSSILAWDIHGQRSLVGSQSTGSQRVGRDWAIEQAQNLSILVLEGHT